MTESEAANIIASGIYVDDLEVMNELNTVTYEALKYRIPTTPNILGEGRYSVMECPNCKQILADKFKFCPHCGQAIDSSRFAEPFNYMSQHD